MSLNLLRSKVKQLERDARVISESLDALFGENKPAEPRVKRAYRRRAAAGKLVEPERATFIRDAISKRLETESLSRVAKKANVSYATLNNILKFNRNMRAETALRLETLINN